ncbi:hypothetical protein [Pseudoalteromonas luteoviolacea]|uniref:Uncharacterized protein n=1 Tax=Pseudoalteromonas luteoviolacea NCIMB 1942 TaxID=1365253 RepID=A0A167B0G1_9GAMM|nr:hypothetical protein [Pseudoalteromonas luteoviolacea]KZN46016.1 hypothetical protein N482_13155 [Pseudoalteromonas luteoviolacea NCIMB 1942]
MLEQQLNSLGDHIILVYVAMWLIYLFVYRRLDSNSIALTCLVLFSLLMNYLTPYVYSFAVNNEGVLPKAIFHLSFCAIQLVAMYVIRVTHSYFKLRMSKESLAIVYLYALQVVVHLVRLTEKAVFGTAYLSSFYMHAIPIVNILLSFVCVLCIVRSKAYKNAENEYL